MFGVFRGSGVFRGAGVLGGLFAGPGGFRFQKDELCHLNIGVLRLKVCVRSLGQVVPSTRTIIMDNLCHLRVGVLNFTVCVWSLGQVVPSIYVYIYYGCLPLYVCSACLVPALCAIYLVTNKKNCCKVKFHFIPAKLVLFRLKLVYIIKKLLKKPPKYPIATQFLHSRNTKMMRYSDVSSHFL